ncbi:uncharacterized protein LOC103515066 [Diaphorina citri]|uniref:Uncharacterized protein LOC103515066 n=1 Tax=Diaphorina citri TaxID=121845 RepID=A0A3Q0J548_DIACI|nr:uncharacterized protein LOC103515066 [Diaphorina citri]XP_026683622.1 uncharacterized protein LOC103515066 [Diaphorina citri]
MPQTGVKAEAGTGQGHVPLPASMSLKLKGQTGAQQYEAWKIFKFQFENYLLATKQDELPEERKCAILLHLLGVEVVQIYQSFNVTGNRTLEGVMQLFERYFSPQKNISLERNVFLSRRQRPGETLEAFFTDLKLLSSTCELSTLRDSLVKDIFILGLSEDNTYIRERLLEEGDKKTLNEIFDLARTIEMSKDKTKMDKMVFGVNKQQRKKPTSEKSKSQCNRCGYRVELPHVNCPAVKASCYKCTGKGHFSTMCRRKLVKKVSKKEVDQEEAAEGQEFFIGSVHANQSSWTAMAEVNKKLINVCLDTGAEANLLSHEEFRSIGLSDKIIKPTNCRLSSYGGTCIPTKGNGSRVYVGQKHFCITNHISRWFQEMNQFHVRVAETQVKSK